MKRDKRLLAAIMLFVCAAVALVVQNAIMERYIYAAVTGWWTANGFSDPTPNGQGCFDFCAPPMPVVAGWIGIGAFVAGLLTVILAWWKPKP